MTTQEIYKLASELTEQQVLNIVRGWEIENDKKSLKIYNGLLQLGDSMQMACSSVIAEKINNVENFNVYRLAYES